MCDYVQCASEFEFLSEIHFSNVLILEDFLRGARRDQGAVAQNIRMTADSEGFTDIMVSNQHADACLLYTSDAADDRT